MKDPVQGQNHVGRATLRIRRNAQSSARNKPHKAEQWLKSKVGQGGRSGRNDGGTCEPTARPGGDQMHPYYGVKLTGGQ